MAIVSKRSSPDGALAELVVSMKHRPSGTPVKALYLLSIANGQGVLSGYQALPEQFDGIGAVFRTVLKDLKVDAAAFSSAAGKQAVDGTKKEVLPPTIDVRTLRITPSDDRTMSVPPDWHVGGGNVSLVATSPDEQMGITATHDHQPRTFDVVAYFNECLMPFYRCTKTTIRKHEPNKEFIQSQRGIGTSTYAETFEGRTVNGDGVTVDFAIMVYATQAAPRMGYVGTLGFYATPELYARNWVPLYCMAASMHPDTNKIMATLRENLDRLGAASRTISQAGDVVIAGIESSTANLDRAIDKFNYYLSGEEARYSPLENRVYVVDSSVGEYAVNPRYAQERLTDVPDRLWNQLPHERQPD